ADFDTVFGPGGTPVPEPGSLGLASVGGLLGVFALRKSTKRPL
ncbi:PEP-CTERM sorting domain-containing protein, partial [Lacticaseibacillus rhamnosus]